MLGKDTFLQLLLIAIAGGFTATIFFWLSFIVISFKITKYRNLAPITVILILTGSIIGTVLSFILFISFFSQNKYLAYRDAVIFIRILFIPIFIYSCCSDTI